MDDPSYQCAPFLTEDAGEGGSRTADMAVLDSFRIGNATLPQSRVRAKLRLLDGMTLRDAENKLHANLEHSVKNSTAYTMAVIFNCIAESESDLMTGPYLNSLRAASLRASPLLLSPYEPSESARMGAPERRE